MEDNVLEIKGRLKIKDDSKFLEALSGAPDPKLYAQVERYAKKILELKAKDIPMGDKVSIISMSIFKAFKGFNPDGGAKFQTYLTSKLRGEVTDYRVKRDSMNKKVNKMLNEERDEYTYNITELQDENTLTKVTNETPETEMLAEDMYRRKIQAFRMSYSAIPSYSQYILNTIVEDRTSLQKIAFNEGVSEDKIKLIRNAALSLILSGVLRSNHLDDDEKAEVRREHGLELVEDF